MSTLTLDEINQSYVYDELTGTFIWKIRKRGRGAIPGRKAGHVGRYCYLRVDGRLWPAHQVVWFIHHGYVPDELDHINQNKHDNRLANLRECNRRQNTGNTTLRSTNKSGRKGVWFAKHAKRWRASIKVNGIAIHLGYHSDLEAAAKAYDAAARKHFGEFAFTNRDGACDA